MIKGLADRVGSSIEASNELLKQASLPKQDKLIVNIDSTEKAEIKSWCARKQISMSWFLKLAADYLMTDVDSGKCVISSTGIKKL